MFVRYLPLLLVLATIALALAPIEAAAQELGSGIRTDRTPSDREAHNGVFDRKTKESKPQVIVGDVAPARAAKPYRIGKASAGKAPQAPSRAGVDTPGAALRDDPRGVEERKDPEP